MITAFISYRLLHAITDIGDSAVLSTAVLIGAGVLVIHGYRKAAVRFVAAFLLTALAIAGSKIFFIGCSNILSHTLNLRSPSGHSGLSAAFFGAMAATIQPFFQQMRRWLLWLTTVLGIFVIAASRVLLGYHTLSEVILGVGLGSAICFWIYRSPLPEDTHTAPNKRTIFVFVLTVLAALTVLHGHHFPAERIIAKLAFLFHKKVAACNS